MSNPTVTMLKDLLKRVESGELVLIDARVSSDPEESATGELDWWFTSRPSKKNLFTEAVGDYGNFVEKLEKIQEETRRSFASVNATKEPNWGNASDRWSRAVREIDPRGYDFFGHALHRLPTLTGQLICAHRASILSDAAFEQKSKLLRFEINRRLAEDSSEVTYRFLTECLTEIQLELDAIGRPIL